MNAILATIALEPNRWTGTRTPRFTLEELIPRAAAHGFDKLELWQWHVSTRFLKAIRTIRAVGDAQGVTFPYIGVYPAFLLAGAEAREEERIQADILDKAEILGATTLKIMLGMGVKGSAATPDQVALIADRFTPWYRAARARGIAMTAELHANTLFDPVETGLAFLDAHPDLDLTLCYQPYDFTDTDRALALADRVAGRISHIHLQAPRSKARGGGYDWLEEAALDYRRLIPHLLRRHPDATLTIEFVKDCLQPAAEFDLERVLENAARDGRFVESVRAGLESRA